MLAIPNKVRAALDAVRESHPYTGDGTIVPSARVEADAAAIWDRLLATPADELARAVAGLTPLEGKITLYGAPARLADVRCLGVLATFFTVREPAGMGRLAFDALLLSGDAAFRPAASAYCGEPSSPKLWKQLAESPSPLSRLVETLERRRDPLSRALATPDIALADRPLIVRALQCKALRPEHLIATCARESLATVAEWVRTLFVDEERVAWYRDYLIATYRTEWPVRNPVLSDIVERFGTPDGARPFWDSLFQQVRAAVSLWLKNRQLTDLLGEGERVRFWRRFLPQMDKLEESRSHDAVFIGFRDCFAVQYKEMGRATYLFDMAHYRDLRWKDEPRLYNRILDLARSDQQLCRYEHRGYAWEVYAHELVVQVLSRQGRS